MGNWRFASASAGQAFSEAWKRGLEKEQEQEAMKASFWRVTAIYRKEGIEVPLCRIVELIEGQTPDIMHLANTYRIPADCIEDFSAMTLIPIDNI